MPVIEAPKAAAVNTRSLEIGDTGEHFAAGLLHGFFDYLSKPSPDVRGIDWCGGGLKEYDLPPDFFIQVKCGHSYRDRGAVVIKRRVFDFWMERVETTPVLILFVDATDFLRPSYFYVVFHDWLIGHVESLRLTDPQWVPKIGFTSFRPIESEASFRSVLIREADRASARANAMWSTNRACRQYLADEGHFLRHLDSIAYYEIPKAVLVKLVDDRRLVDFTRVRGLVRQLWRDERLWTPEFRLWVEDVKEVLKMIPGASDHQRRQFRFFRNNVDSFQRGGAITLPALKVNNVICWRAFVSMYPESFSLIETVLGDFQHRRASELRFALAVASTVANSGLDPLVRRAQASIHLVHSEVDATRVQDYESYVFKREYFRSRLEAGMDPTASAAKVLTLVRDKHAIDEGWEIRHLKSYGWGDIDSIRTNIHRKLTLPKERDVNSMAYYETLEGLL